jgi:hypothetical protein
MNIIIVIIIIILWGFFLLCLYSTTQGITTSYLAGAFFKRRRIRGISNYGLAIYIKIYLRAEEELCKLKYFTMQKYNLQKIL